MVAALDPSTVAGIAQYTGQATHLGRFTRTECFFLEGQGGMSGTIVFTAANGDQIRLDFHGKLLHESGTIVPGSYGFDCGTGRFRHAAGSAAFRAVLDDQGYVEVTFEGTISY